MTAQLVSVKVNKRSLETVAYSAASENRINVSTINYNTIL